MASYQEIDTRLAVIEDKVNFIMRTGQMTAAIQSGLLDDEGVPLPPKMFKGSLEDVYKLSKQMPTELESDNG